MSTWKSRALVVVAGVAVLVTGCTSGSSGPPATSSATSASTPASPTTSTPGPSLPAAARAQDAAGAQEFVKYWFDVVNYTFTSRDTTLFRSLALPECKFCADFASRVDQARAMGKTFEGGRFTAKVVVAPRPEQDGNVLVDSRTDIGSGRVLSSSGAVLEASTGGTDYAVTLRLKRGVDGWRVSGVAKE